MCGGVGGFQGDNSQTNQVILGTSNCREGDNRDAGKRLTPAGGVVTRQPAGCPEKWEFQIKNNF